MGRDIYALYGVKDSHMAKVAKFALVAGDADAVASLGVNPEDEDVTIIQATLFLETVTSAAAITLDIGTAATVVTDDTIFDGADVKTAVGAFLATSASGGTNGSLKNGVPKVWTKGHHITQKSLGGASTGMVGSLVITYMAKVQELD